MLISRHHLQRTGRTTYMKYQDENEILYEVKDIARELHRMLRDDSLRRLRLNQLYSDPETLKWTPDLVRRSLLAESIYKKLNNLICQKNLDKLKKAV
jgi:hypothetical protein